MIKFKNYTELLKSIGAEYKSDFIYGENQLRGFLEGVGSDVNEAEPICCFDVEFNNINYELGVTSKEIAEDSYEDTYWIISIGVDGKEWKEVKGVLEKHIVTDMSNFDDNCGIVDFDGSYEEYSVKGYIIKSNDEVTVEIKDDEIVYKNR